MGYTIGQFLDLKEIKDTLKFNKYNSRQLPKILYFQYTNMEIDCIHTVNAERQYLCVGQSSSRKLAAKRTIL